MLFPLRSANGRDRREIGAKPGEKESPRVPLRYRGRSAKREYRMPLKMKVHDREPITLALRRFKKLLERSGIQKELRKRKYYEKPCEARRRAELRKQSAIRKAKTGTRKP